MGVKKVQNSELFIFLSISTPPSTNPIISLWGFGGKKLLLTCLQIHLIYTNTTLTNATTWFKSNRVSHKDNLLTQKKYVGWERKHNKPGQTCWTQKYSNDVLKTFIFFVYMVITKCICMISTNLLVIKLILDHIKDPIPTNTTLPERPQTKPRTELCWSNKATALSCSQSNTSKRRSA